MRYFFLYWYNSKAASVYSLKFIREKKLKYKKNFDKSFHRNIHKFALSRHQKTEKYEPLLILQTLTRIAIGAVFREIQCFSRSIRQEMFLEKQKKIAKFTGVKRRCWSLSFIKLRAEDQ